MENIDHMGQNSLEALSKDNLSDRGKKKLAREIVCGAAAIACLLVGLLFERIFPNRAVVAYLLYTIGFVIEGVPIFLAAVKGVMTKNLVNAMEILVAIAILACFFNHQLILAVLIPLILNAAHFLEERSIMGGREVIEGLKKMQQKNAILLEDGVEKEVDARSLRAGQIIVLRPGNGIPIDGRIVKGETDIDQKSMTGEPEPYHATVGDPVYAGTVNIDGQVQVIVEKEYVDTSFSKILKLLEQSEGISVPESRLIDRFMGYYIPFVLAVAAAVALVASDITKAIAILVVSCPCGQMLVSSAPMIAALSVATKHGILIKNSKFIEELTDVDTVVFDKTGTLTEGNLSMCEVYPYYCTEQELLSAVLSVANGSDHPVCRAVCRGCAALPGVAPFGEYSVSEQSGKGVTGFTADGNSKICFGNAACLAAAGVSIPEDAVYSSNRTASYVGYDGRFLGCVTFSDRVRADAEEGIAALRKVNVSNVTVLTGDRTGTAAEVCREVGADAFYAELLPEDKLNILKGLKQEGNVVAIGDGINDALALREADVGIAMGAMGSDLAIVSADIALMNNNLTNVSFAIRLARQTRRIIYQNLALSIATSALMIALSAFGVISALAGSVLHNLGAFIVLLNSSRILKWD